VLSRLKNTNVVLIEVWIFGSSLDLDHWKKSWKYWSIANEKT